MSDLRQRAVRLAPVALAGLLAILVAACGNDGNGDDGASGDVTPVVRTPLAADPLPTVDGNNVTSPGKGYAVRYPDGWEPRFNFAITPLQRVDAYFAPDPDGDPEVGVRANIAVTCDTIPDGTLLDDYFARKRDLIRSVAGIEPPDAAQITVAGAPAMRVEYNEPQAQGDDLRKVDTYLVKGRCGYNISLTAEQPAVAGLIGAYDAFLESFTLL